MHYTPLEQKIKKLAAPVIEDLGFSLHHIRITGETGASSVQIMAEDLKTKNLGVDDAAKISRALSAVMDVEDPINGAYRLEISSPGIDRLLITKDDFETYEGFEAKIETSVPAENGQKRYRGILSGTNENNVILETDCGTANIDLTAISKAKLILTDELIKTTAKWREENGTTTSR